MRSREFINEENDKEFARKLDKYYRDRAAKAAATKAKHKGSISISGSSPNITDKAKEFWNKHGYKIKDTADKFYQWQQADLKKSTLK
jgi:hypothetical protein